MIIPHFKRFKTYGPRMILDVLEERIVLDASVAPAANNQHHHHHHHDFSGADHVDHQPAVDSTAPATTAAPDPTPHVFNQDLKVVLISNVLGQVDAISKAIAPDAKVITYDGQNGDIQTIVNSLKSLVDSTGHKIEELELLSYGQPGILQLSENSLFGAYTVSSNPIPWQTLGTLLAPGAKIDLWGCNIGQGADGTALVNTISSIAHATVWASDNTTGSGPNADWVLETHSGDSTLWPVLNVNVLKSLNVTLDNSNMTNPGFETGDFTGWTLTQSADLAVVNASTGGNYGGINVGPSPYAAFGSVDMARVSDANGSGPWTEATMPKISQTFTYNTPDHLVFAYDVVTSDGYGGTGSDYTGYDNFGYKVSVTHSGVTTDVVNVLDHSGDVYPNQWKLLRQSGWQTVDIDLSQYAKIGDSVTVQFYAGNTVDNLYDTWMYVDMQKTTPVTKSLYTQGVLDLTLFENTGSATNTVRSLDNIFADNLYPNSQLTLSVTGDTNPSLFSSISIDPTTHQLTLGQALYAFGSAQITIHAVDPAAHTLDYTFNFTVLPVAVSPTSTGADFYTAFGGAIPVTLTGYDPDSDPVAAVSFTVVTNPTHGTLSGASAITTDGQGHYYQTYTYTPSNSTYSGDDPFTFRFNTPSGTWKGFSGGTNLTNETGYVQSMELSDVNNNGYPVLVTAATTATDGTGDAAHYYYANTTGTFGAPTRLGNDSTAARDVAVVDIDGDGHSDVIMLNGNAETGKYYLWDNSGFAGTQFDTGVNIAGTATPTNGTGVIAVGDMNGDGLKDIVMGTSGGSLILFKNLGNNTFDTGTVIASGLNNVSAVAIGDLNNDGYLDIVAGRNGYSTQVYQGHANGTFTLAATLPNTSSTTPATYSIALGDVDGDGNLDIVEGNYATTLAGVNKFYRNTGNFTFAESSITSDQDNTAGIRLADVNHDGHLDVLVSNFGTTGQNKCYIFDNATKMFDTAAINIGAAANRFFSSAAGDVNNDGFTDFVAGRWNTTGGSAGTTTNVLYTNQGLNNLSSTIATDTIHNSSPLRDWDFSNNYTGWTVNYGKGSGLVEESLPATDGSQYVQDGTFAIISGTTTTITMGSTLYDYMNGNSQAQWSPYMPLTISGQTGNNVALHTSNAPQHVWLAQDFDMPTWSGLKTLKLQWDMEYWNHLGSWVSGTQDLAVYVYDVSNTSPSPVWITTAGVDAATQATMKTYSTNLPLTLQGHHVELVFEASVLGNFMEFGLDNFKFSVDLVNTGTVPTITAPTLGSVFGPGGTLPAHIAGGVLPGSPGMMSVSAAGSELSALSASSSLGTADTTTLLTTIEGSSAVTPTSTTTSHDTSATSTQTQTTTTTGSSTTAYSAVTLGSPDPVQITPDPAPTTRTTTPDLLALALTPADTTPPQASLDDLSGTAFASIDKGDSGHDYSFDLKTTLVFDLDDVSPLHLLSLNAPVPVNPLDLSEQAMLGEKLSAGRSVAVSLDSMRFSDIFC